MKNMIEIQDPVSTIDFYSSICITIYVGTIDLVAFFLDAIKPKNKSTITFLSSHM
jgi:hypothetical protein